MQRRVAALEEAGVDVVAVLWRRLLDAEQGDGFRYEYAAAAHE